MNDTQQTQKPTALIIGAVIIIAAVALGLGIAAWRVHVIKAEDERNYQTAQELIAADRPIEALAVIEEHNRSILKPTEENKARWLDLEITARDQTGQISWLQDLYARSPKSFDSHENAVIHIGRAMLPAAEFDAFDKLREAWRNRGTNAVGWFELDADALVLKGKREEAKNFLNSRSFPGAADSGRLLRLAFLDMSSDPTAAWQSLERAVAVDPRNAEIRSLRGQILENSGRRPEAHVEFMAAFLTDTNNPVLRDQLAEFYRRGGNFNLAVRTWAGGLTDGPSSGVIWLKTYFWSHVSHTVNFDWRSAQPPAGILHPFVSYLLNLPPGKFWDEAAFEKLPEARRYEQQLQETFWLKLLSALNDGTEDQALNMLQTNSFRQNSWYLELESVLMRVLEYRRTGEMKFPPGVSIRLSDAPPKTRHQLFEQIDESTRDPKQPLPADTDRLLRSKDAFAALFLAADWPEAALTLPHSEVVPEDYPEWVAYGFTQAHRFNRGARDAVAFAAKQKASPKLELLTGEILLSGDNMGEGLIKLSELAKSDSDLGAQAAQMVAQTYAHLKQYNEARAAIEAQPRLRQSVIGQEMLARLALSQEDKASAEKIYQAIEADSDEAKEFLAKIAFERKDWPRARALTEQLLKKHPDSGQLRTDLEQIARARRVNERLIFTDAI